MRRLSSSAIVAAGRAGRGAILAAWALALLIDGRGGAAPPAAPPTAAPLSHAGFAAEAAALKNIPFDGSRAYGYLQNLCSFGPRSSGSPGMLAQRQLLVEHFRRLGAQVELQEFEYPHPLSRTPVSLVNIVVRWHPERRGRILLGTHYDTLPWPLRDPHNKRGVFVGANDGGSGTALLMALGHDMPGLPAVLGVDFAFFDAEEFLFDERGHYFVGAEHFARQYTQRRARDPQAERYQGGLLLDMIGTADLHIYREARSDAWPDVRPIADAVWATAGRLGVGEFLPQHKYEVPDDHVPLHDIGGIACCEIIDYDYPYWHTQADTPEHCSALSLAKVGWVVREWLQGAR